MGTELEQLGVKMWRHRRSPDRFDDVLARCLTAIEADGASIDSCLAAYPQHAERLAPALRTALALRQSLAARPDPAFALRARQRMMQAAGTGRATPVTSAAVPARPARWSWQAVGRPLAMSAAAFVLIVVLFTPVVFTASAGALPGDWNYSVKRAKERVELALGISSHLDIADERANELKELADSGGYKYISYVTEVTRAYQSELVKAREPLERNPPAPVAEAQRLVETVGRQETIIESVREKVKQDAQARPGAVAPAVVQEAQQATQSALSTAAVTREQAAAAVERAHVLTTATATATPAKSPTAGPALASSTAQTRSPEPSATGTPPSAAPTAPATPSGTVSGAPPAPSPAVTAPITPVVPPAAAATAATGIPSSNPSGNSTPPATPTPTPTPRATVTPAPTGTAAPQPTARPSAAGIAPAPTASATEPPVRRESPSPSPPTATATPEVRARLIELHVGVNYFIYRGATASPEQAFAGLAGKFAWIEWRPPGSSFTLRYVPRAAASGLTILTGSTVAIEMTESVVVPLGAIWVPELSR